jgi:predicted kinase
MPKLIVLIGSMGCGKTTLCEERFLADGFFRVNQDDQGKKTHFQLFLKLLENAEDIVVDRMNFNKEQRMRYVEPARKAGYQIRYILFHVSRETCIARMKVRKNHPTIGPDANHDKLMNFFTENFEYPEEDEYDYMENQYE